MSCVWIPSVLNNARTFAPDSVAPADMLGPAEILGPATSPDAPEPDVEVLGALAAAAGVVEVVAGVFQPNSRDSQPLPLEVSD